MTGCYSKKTESVIGTGTIGYNAKLTNKDQGVYCNFAKWGAIPAHTVIPEVTCYMSNFRQSIQVYLLKTVTFPTVRICVMSCEMGCKS